MSDTTASSATRKSIRSALIIAGIQVGGALLLTLARTQGLISADTTTRGVMVLLGLGLALYGNRMPKALEGPAPQSLDHATLRQSVLRVGGWAMTLAGLAYAGFWAVAPRDLALLGSMSGVGIAMLVLFGHLAWSIHKAHRSKTH